jgi:hypothetical protein
MLSNLTAIPRIMRTMNWMNGARLLEIWFSRSSTTRPVYSAPYTTTIRMDSWALTFGRARQVYDRLLLERIWSNQPAKLVVARMLRRKGLLSTQEVSFGRLSDPVPVQDADYVNERGAGTATSFDDLTAALGKFLFRVVVAGTVVPVPAAQGSAPRTAAFRVRVTEVGVYIRDSFDFEGNQSPGCWSDAQPPRFSPILTPAFGPGGGAVFMPQMILTSVGNRDFREWRQRNGRGGDFLVFSDMKRLRLTTPDEFIVS